MSLLCKIFGHKYIKTYAGEGQTFFEHICKRCGKNRDLYMEGEPKNPNIKYFRREDGKKDKKKAKKQ